jgi:hypothetical protein
MKKSCLRASYAVILYFGSMFSNLSIISASDSLILSFLDFKMLPST